MRVAFLIVLAVALTLGCRPACAPNQTALAADLADKTVALVNQDTQHVYCSGVWVATDEILTADHCMEGKAVGDAVDYSVQTDVTIVGTDTRIVARPGAVLALDEEHDLALIKTGEGTPLHGTAVPSVAEPEQGQSVYTCSAPYGLTWSYSSGQIASIRLVSEDDHLNLYVQATAPISPGSSGSGLFDGDGRLIGIARMTYHEGQALNFWVHHDHVVAFLLNARASEARL